MRTIFNIQNVQAIRACSMLDYLNPLMLEIAEVFEAMAMPSNALEVAKVTISMLDGIQPEPLDGFPLEIVVDRAGTNTPYTLTARIHPGNVDELELPTFILPSGSLMVCEIEDGIKPLVQKFRDMMLAANSVVAEYT